MEVSNLVWNFNLVYSSLLNSKLFFKMIMHFHVKNSTRYIEFKFQLGLSNPRWNFNPGWKFWIFHIINTFWNPVWKFDTTHAQIPYLSCFKKIKIATWPARFKRTDDKRINLIKFLKEFKSSMNFMKLSFVMRKFFFQLLAEVFFTNHLKPSIFYCVFFVPINTWFSRHHSFLYVFSFCHQFFYSHEANIFQLALKYFQPGLDFFR